MTSRRRTRFETFALSFDALVIAATWLALTALRSNLRQYWSFDIIPGEPVLEGVVVAEHAALTPLVVACWLVFLHQNRTYANLRRASPATVLMRVSRGAVTALFVLLGLLFAAQLTSFASRTLIFGFALTSVPVIFASRMAMVRYLRSGGAEETSNVVIVGAPGEAGPLIDTLGEHAEWGVRILGIVRPDETPPAQGPIDDLGTLRDLPRLLREHEVTRVMLTGHLWNQETMRHVAAICDGAGVQLSMDASFLGPHTGRADLDDFDGLSMLTFSTSPAEAGALAIKRAMDIVLSGLALVVLSPVLGITALLIKLHDGGPVLFSQERAGLFGKPFPMHKFRSMVPDAEARKAELDHLNEMDGPVFKIKRDPRITPIGAFIRKTSIDELPQFWNVFVGQMSLVGPRPPIPAEVEQYQRWQMRRLSMKPGITCIWQVSGRNQVDFDTWMKLDLQYIDNWSLALDVKLLAKTVPVVLIGHGAS